MNNFLRKFKFSNQKEYDGPASHLDLPPAIATSNRPPKDGSLGTGATTASAPASDRDRSRRRQHDVHRRPPPTPLLAPGISSARVSREVSDASSQGASVGRPPSVVVTKTRRTVAAAAGGLEDDDGRGDGGNERARRGRRVGSRVPMEHDGGVLCLCAVPGPRGGGGDARRFLSGGADGVVRFWEARDDGGGGGGGGGGMTPRLVRAYHGHAGYVHSIAVLGTCDATFPTRRKSRDDALLKVLSAVVPSSAKRMGNSGHNGLDESGHSLGERKKKTMLLFVSASRDNTVRIWPIVDEDGGNEDGGVPTIDDSEGRSSSDDDDPIYKGIKLRGHRFGKDGIGGVLCVCALPSLPTVEEDADDVHCQGDRSVHSGISRDDVTAASGNDYEGTESAGQFCSGGSDGVVRVWDVRSALNLQKTPKSGMYATIQLQCLRPPGGPDRSSPAITSLVCTRHRGDGVVRGARGTSLFSGDAVGTVRRYSCMNEAGNVNGALWWGLTGLFVGHDHSISGMVMLSSPSLLGLLRPDWECRDRPDVREEDDEEECGTMLVSSCEDGWVRVWDACDARLGASGRRNPTREPMWEIDLNEDNGDDGPRPGRIGATSLTALQAGTLVAAGTTDGKIRMWNVSSGLYEGAYNLGRSVQVWSLGVLSERDDCGELAEYDYDERGRRERTVRTSAGVIVSGDNQGRIRVMRKVSSIPI